MKPLILSRVSEERLAEILTEEGLIDPAKPGNFTLKADSLVFYFGDYKLGYFNDGLIRVAMPLAQFKRWFRLNSPVHNLLHR